MILTLLGLLQNLMKDNCLKRKDLNWTQTALTANCALHALESKREPMKKTLYIYIYVYILRD